MAPTIKKPLAITEMWSNSNTTIPDNSYLWLDRVGGWLFDRGREPFKHLPFPCFIILAFYAFHISGGARAMHVQLVTIVEIPGVIFLSKFSYRASKLNFSANYFLEIFTSTEPQIT